jgi:hypothetical protein
MFNFQVRLECGSGIFVFPCGVIVDYKDPDTIALPTTAVNGWDAAVVVSGDTVYAQGKKVNTE